MLLLPWRTLAAALGATCVVERRGSFAALLPALQPCSAGAEWLAVRQQGRPACNLAICCIPLNSSAPPPPCAPTPVIVRPHLLAAVRRGVPTESQVQGHSATRALPACCTCPPWLRVLCLPVGVPGLRGWPGIRIELLNELLPLLQGPGHRAGHPHQLRLQLPGLSPAAHHPGELRPSG